MRALVVHAAGFHARQLARFCAVGASGYVVNLVVFASVDALGVGHLLAAVVAFCVALVNNYTLNRRWTFASLRSTAKRKQAPRFVVVSLMAFLVSLGILEALVTELSVRPLLAQAVAIVVATPVSFAGQKLWSFREAPGVSRPVQHEDDATGWARGVDRAA